MNRVGDNLICTGTNEEIINVFDHHNVEFIVIGGLAVSWYCHGRAADDMDLMVDPSVINSEKIATAMGQIHNTIFECKDFAKAGLQIQLKKRHYADIISPPEDLGVYEDLAGGSVNGHVFDIPVRIISIKNLIKLKKYTITLGQDIEKHESDIECLNQCQRN